MKIKASFLVVVVMFFSACAYANVRAPLDTNVSGTKLGSKVGYSSSQSVMHLVAWGDSGVEAAARDGGLTTVEHLDMQYFSILFGLYTKVTTIAYGD